jgi:hypothetical protein
MGGDVYSMDGTAHLYVAPGSLTRDATIIVASREGSGPDTLADGSRRVTPEWTLGWTPAALTKPAAFDLAVPELPEGPNETVAFYHRAPDGVWTRLGGTRQPDTGHMSTTVSESGSYALFAEASGAVQPGLSAPKLSFVPRILDSRGIQANAGIGIGFTLARPGAVTVQVYNRAGRLVREVVRSAYLGSGANLVHWDGRDGEGRAAEAGIYVIAVETPEGKRMGVVAVER